MERVARFEKVSEEQFIRDFKSSFGEKVPEEEIRRMYEAVRLPVRATSGSAGYDFFSPLHLSLRPGESVRIPTGIRASVQNGWVLLLMPRSSLGFKFRIQLSNTVGVIDSDYYGSDNEGHILIKLINAGREGLTADIPEGKAFAQGLFVPFGITEDDACEGERHGGLGSTDEA